MKENNYSRIQYVLWLISGSEISILKNCPTDYNRHAGIGFTILMTTVFGMFAGGYAGYYFSQSVLGAICFVLLWGLLIFSIDRTMVVSLKKKPDTKWWQFAWQIFFRAILAALIAFIISIPLELLVFRDNIDAGKEFYQQSQLLQLSKGYDTLYRPDQDQRELNRTTAVSEAADSISKLDPQDAEFRAFVADLNESRGNLRSAQGNLAKERALANRYYRESLVPNDNGGYTADRSSGSYQQYLAAKKRQAVLGKEIGKLNKEIAGLSSSIQERRRAWKEKYVAESDSAKRKAGEIDKEIALEKKKKDSATTKLDETLAKTENSFVVRFDVLSFLANKKNDKGAREFASIFFLLWLIRILFFVIEILPTIVKVATPFGAYDAAVFEAEENFKNIKLVAARELLREKVKREHDLEKEERERQLKYRMQKEGVLHDKLVDEISETQNFVAKQILEEWKQKHSAITPSSNLFQ